MVASRYAAVLLAVAGLVGYLVRDSGHPAADAGTVAFDPATRVLRFDLAAFAGGRLTTEQLAGQPAVVNFYASWCHVCDGEMPDFEKVHRAFAGRVAVVGVNPQSNDTDRAQARMVRRTGVTYPTARDVDDRLLRLFNRTGALPTTVFLDPAGRVVDVVNGQLLQPQLEAKLAELFGIR